LEYAIDLAQKYDAQLHVLYVVDVRANSGFNMWPDMLEELQAVGKEVTQEIADKSRKSGIEVITERGKNRYSIQGDQYSILEKNDIDLITMGTRGKTGLDRILLGSVTEKIIRTSQVPVLTVGSKIILSGLRK